MSNSVMPGVERGVDDLAAAVEVQLHAEVVGAESDDGDGETGVAETTKVHDPTLRQPGSERACRMSSTRSLASPNSICGVLAEEQRVLHAGVAGAPSSA